MHLVGRHILFPGTPGGFRMHPRAPAHKPTGPTRAVPYDDPSCFPIIENYWAAQDHAVPPSQVKSRHMVSGVYGSWLQDAALGCSRYDC